LSIVIVIFVSQLKPVQTWPFLMQNSANTAPLSRAQVQYVCVLNKLASERRTKEQ